MKLIRLSGKYAIGDHTHTMVDDDDFEWLNRYRWKAKWNGSRNNIYAIRTQRGSDLRMHRVICGYAGDEDIDHKNHNSLDNRRSNLRIVSRTENILNQRQIDVNGCCANCGINFTRLVARSIASRIRYCSDRCANLASAVEYAPSSSVFFSVCLHCSKSFVGRYVTATYCDRKCRRNARYARQCACGSLPPSQARSAERSREWRLTQRCVIA